MISRAVAARHPQKQPSRKEEVTDEIVVGVDGSEGSTRALLWAADEARLRRAQLRVVLAWEPPVRVVGGVGWVIPDEQQLGEYGRLAEERLAAILAEHASALAGLDVAESAVHGAPAVVLLREAAGAGLLVVGTRGHGGFVGLLLGSVSAQCAHHAPCPLVIVPGEPR
jgi:nucleotide-binding universal stress UspA family protein